MKNWGIIGLGVWGLVGVLLNFPAVSNAADAEIVQVYQAGEGGEAKFILNPPELYVTKIRW